MSIDARAKSYGKIWGGWTIGKLLGTGSGGKTAVFQLTRDNLTFTENCAMKVVNIIDEQVSYDEISDEYREYYLKRKEEMRRAAEAEVNLMHQLKDCYNIVQYSDFEFNDWQEESAFGTDLLIRMDLLGNLNSKMKKEGVTQSEIVQIGIDICTALEGCAAHNIIHRDIKPDNIFNNGRQYLLGDFGISKIIENGMGAQTNKGTAHYAAPEQFANATNSNYYDNKVDIYSLALTLYVLANKGKLPFTDKVLNNQLAIQMRLTGTPFPRIDGVNPELMDVILVGCSFKPEDRFKTATAFKNALLYVKDKIKHEEMEKVSSNTGTTSNNLESYETEEALKSQEGVKTEKLASEGLVSYNTEPALEMASETVSQPAESYETQPALEMTPATPGKEEESYETQPALEMIPATPGKEEESYETQPALEMTPITPEKEEESYETQPALEMTPITPGKEEESYETQPALEMTPVSSVKKEENYEAQSVMSAQPKAPVQPATPVQPVAPAQSVSPVQPVAPAQSVSLVQPVAPAQSVTPAQSTTPVQPVQLSYVEMENLKGMAKAKIASDDRDGAFGIFMQLVAAGEHNVMYTEISKIFNSNKEVKKNPEAAIFWYERCIENTKDSWTISLAENRLGEIYSNGIGVKKDHELAEKYYRSSAAKGNPYAKKKFVAGKYVK